MKTSLPTLAAATALLAAMATSALSDDRLSGQVSLTAASGACPTSLVSGDQPLAVHFVLSGAASAMQPTTNRFRYNYNLPQAQSGAKPVLKISGEIRDYGVPGCTVSFEGGTAARLAAAWPQGMAPQARGCRGACGL